MKRIILFFLICSSLTTAVRINEVMYNPEGSDNNREYVEIYGVDNLTGYVVSDLNTNDSLQEIKYVNGSFALIVEEGFNHSGINASIYSVGATIGNGLSNEGDAIALYFNGTKVDSMNYTGPGVGVEYWNNTFYPSNGTPGFQNKNPFLRTEHEEDNETRACNLSVDLEIKNEKKMYEEGDTIYFKNTLNEDVEAVIEYQVKDVFGQTIRKKTTENTNEKQFTPKLEKSEQAFIISNKILSANCSIANRTSSEIVYVKGKNGEGKKNSCFEYEEKIKDLERQLEEKEQVLEPKCEEEKTATLESFYTRKRKFDPEITLYSRIKGSGIYKMQLTTEEGSINKSVIVNGSKTLDFVVPAKRGGNLYVMELLNYRGEVLDSEKLVVEFEKLVKESEVKVLNEEVHKDEKFNSSLREVQPRQIYEEKNIAATFLIGASILASLIILGVVYWNTRNPSQETLNPFIEESELKANFIKESGLPRGYGRGRDSRKD